MIDVAMLDCQLAILENALTTHLVTGEQPGRLGTRHPNIAPFQAFEAGDGSRSSSAPATTAQFAALCAAIDRPELPQRRALPHAPTLDGVTSTRSQDDAARRCSARVPPPSGSTALERAGMPCAPGEHGGRCRAHAAGRRARHGRRHRRPRDRRASPSPATRSRWHGVPDPPPRRPPPDLDADRAAILAWLDARSARAGAQPPRAPSTLQMPGPRAEMKRKTKQ